MRWGLGTKLITYVTVGVLLTSTLMGVLRFQNERGLLTRLIDETGQSMANATSSGAASLVAGYDYGNLEILTRNVSRQPHVERVVIRNQAGRTMTEAHSGPVGAYKRFESAIMLDGRPLGRVTVDMSTEVLAHALEALYWRVLVEQLVFGAILGLIVYFFIACGVVLPIRKLTSTMEEAVEKGGAHLAGDLKVGSSDEIGRLVTVFNKLNKSLAGYHRQLQGKIDFANQELRDKNIQLGGRTRELERALDLLSTMATTDWLTELANRRKFDESLTQMFHQSERFAETITLVLFDLDRFKAVNDSYGHGAGDSVLRDVSTLLRLHVRKADLPARLGGDEFGVVLYHTDAAQAEVFVREFMASVRQHVFSYEGVRLCVTLSVGIAQYDRAMKAPQALYRAADEALYQAKNEGRDRYCVFSETTPLPERKAL